MRYLHQSAEPPRIMPSSTARRGPPGPACSHTQLDQHAVGLSVIQGVCTAAPLSTWLTKTASSLEPPWQFVREWEQALQISEHDLLLSAWLDLCRRSAALQQRFVAEWDSYALSSTALDRSCGEIPLCAWKAGHKVRLETDMQLRSSDAKESAAPLKGTQEDAARHIRAPQPRAAAVEAAAVALASTEAALAAGCAGRLSAPHPGPQRPCKLTSQSYT